MMRYIVTFFTLLFFSNVSLAQYKFKIEKKIQCTSIKDQAKTNTCWSFATASFIESELIRMGKGHMNISEMFIVRNVYKDKARNYILRQGKANFAEGSLGHDLLRIATKDGLITEEAYSGLVSTDDTHNHFEMSNALKGFLDGVRNSKILSTKWQVAMNGILDGYLGVVPSQFDYKNKTYTPTSFVKEIGLNLNDYVSITSFTHHPFYTPFILEIPDNYSNGAFYNIPMDEMMAVLDYALLSGYSVTWDGDVTEKGFSAKNGIAVLAVDANRKNLFSKPGKECNVNQEIRQTLFENYSTTDDHLMHIIGIALDQDGTKYYITKNSWGEISNHKGFVYMSESYVKMKTVSILLHKDGIPEMTSKKLRLKE